MTIPDDRRIAYEHGWANHAAKTHLDRSERNLWHTFKYVSRTFAYAEKVYVVWKMNEEDVQVLATFQLCEVSLELNTGLLASFRDSRGGLVLLSPVPSKLRDLDVFVWVPAFNEVRFTPRNWNNVDDERVLRVALNFKQMRSLDGGAEFDTHYFSELRDFQRLNPYHPAI